MSHIKIWFYLLFKFALFYFIFILCKGGTSITAIIGIIVIVASVKIMIIWENITDSCIISNIITNDITIRICIIRVMI